MRTNFQTSRARLTPWQAAEFDELIATWLLKEKGRVAAHSVIKLQWTAQKSKTGKAVSFAV